MYRPEAFAEDRSDVLCGAMSDIQFAALVSTTSDGLHVTHVPMFVRQEDGVVTLEAHVARANPHWRMIADGAPSVAIFQGPHAYISPSWYASKAEHGKVVPTWAYIAVHAHGTLAPMSDDAWLRRHLEALTTVNEVVRETPWAVSDAPEPYIKTLSRGIVGLKLTVQQMSGSWKINQHKTDADRAGTAKGLMGAGEDGRTLAQALIESTR
jgi:transcriptional regulator